MLSRQTLKNDEDFIKNIKNLCFAYEQISVIKMNKIKPRVLYTRNFFFQLSDVYVSLKNTYRSQVLTLVKKNETKNIKKMLLLGKSEKSASIFLSANTSLYGDIMNKVFNAFVKDTKTSSDDLIIVGKLGKKMYDTAGSKKNYQYFEISDKETNIEDLKQILKTIVDYSVVNVYFGQYSSFFTQEAVKKDITGNVFEENSSDVKEKNFYYFEPNLEKILYFFETQILTSFFRQTVFENQLARYASRIKAMEQSLFTIGGEEKKMIYSKRKFERYLADKKQNERVNKIIFRANL